MPSTSTVPEKNPMMPPTITPISTEIPVAMNPIDSAMRDAA
jgi:hypothetical protein